MTDFDKTMEAELLKYVSEKGKINLMTETHKIMESGMLSCLCHSSLASFVQKRFLNSDLTFCYDLIQSRNGIKIIGLSKGHADKTNDINMLINYPMINNDIATHLLNQFYDKKDTLDIIGIAAVYNAIVNIFEEIKLFVCLDNNIVDKIYNYANDDFVSKQHIKNILEDIKTYGYCFNKNGEVYWKLFNADVEINEKEINDFFTIVNEIIENEEDIYPAIEQKQVEKEFTTQDALNLIAKELGFKSIEQTKSKLDEVLAITNELIDDLDSMQDWEKLMNWKTFVLEWKTIMGEALNDNN